MVLRNIDLQLFPDEYDGVMRSKFLFRCRYVTSFIERKVRALKFQAKGFGRIVVEGKHAETNNCPILSENVAVPSVAFDQIAYETLGPGEHHEFFIGMLVDGLRKCAKHHRIPLKEMMSFIEEFRRGGYKNEWTHQKKVLRPFGLKGSLACLMDTERFVLRLILERGGVVVFNREILVTKPDEIIFAHRFKEVVAEGGEVVVKDLFGKRLFSVDPASLQ